MSNVRYRMNAQDVVRAYDRWAHIYDASFAIFTSYYQRKMIAQINQCQGRVLDVGVGTGVMLPHYQPHLKVTGIDISPAMLKRAHMRVENHNLTHIQELIEIDAAKTHFPNNSFDVIAAAFVMSVVPDPKQVLRELDRLLVPNGDLFILNHFRHEKGLRWFVERMMAPLSSLLGWHPDMPLEDVCDNCAHQLISQKEFKPFGIFTMLHFRKQK